MRRTPSPALRSTRAASSRAAIIAAVICFAAAGCTTTPPASSPPSPDAAEKKSATATVALDDNFAPQLISSAGGAVYASHVLAGGRVLIGGAFDFVNNTPCRYLACLGPDGALDANFPATAAPDSRVVQLAALPDGRVVVAGAFRHFGNQPAAGIVRLLPDGRLDPHFHPPTTADGVVTAIALLPDGRVLVGGEFEQFGDRRVPNLARLLPDGSIDPKFAPATETSADRPGAVLALAADAGGRVLVLRAAGRNSAEPADGSIALPGWAAAPAGVALARLRADGTNDPEFHYQPSGTVAPRAIAGLPGGDFLTIGARGLERLYPDGTVDGRFRFPELDEMNVLALAAWPDGRLLVGGVPIAGATLPARLVVLAANGEVAHRLVMPRDETHSFASVSIGPAGEVIAAGRVAPVSGALSSAKSANRVLRLNAELAVDRRFRADIGGAANVSALAFHPDGKITVAGTFNLAHGESRRGLLRLRADGSLDETFDPGADFGGNAHVLVPTVDGGVIAAGNFAASERGALRGVVRLRSNGAVEPFFAREVPVEGEFADAAALPDGSIVFVGRIIGTTGDMDFSNLVRIDPSGRVDRRLATAVRSWLPQGSGEILAVAATPGGHLLVAGEFSLLQGQPRAGLARIGGEGLVDPAFVPQTDAFRSITRVTVLRDGRIFVEGWAQPAADGITRRLFARLLADGRGDPTFHAARLDGFAPITAAPLPDGTTLVMVRDLAADAPHRRTLLQLDRDGAPLRDFRLDLGNTVGATKLIPAPDGSIYIAGAVASVGGQPRYGLARIVTRQPE